MGRSCGSCNCDGGHRGDRFVYKRLPNGFTDCIGHPALPIDYSPPYTHTFPDELANTPVEPRPYPAWDSGHWIGGKGVFSPGWSFKYDLPALSVGIDDFGNQYVATYFAVDDQARVYTFSRQNLTIEAEEFTKKLLRIRRYSPDSDSWQTVLEFRHYPRWVFNGQPGQSDIRGGKIAIVGPGAKEHHSGIYQGEIALFDLENSGELLWSRNLHKSVTFPDGLNLGWDGSPDRGHSIRSVRIGPDGDVYIAVYIGRSVIPETDQVYPVLMRLDAATGAIKGWYGRFYGLVPPGEEYPYVRKGNTLWAFDINADGEVLVGIPGDFGDGAGGAYVRLEYDEDFETTDGDSDPTSYCSSHFKEAAVIISGTGLEWKRWGNVTTGLFFPTGNAAWGGSNDEVVFPYTNYATLDDPSDPDLLYKLCKASGGTITEAYVWGFHFDIVGDLDPDNPLHRVLVTTMYKDATGWYHTYGTGLDGAVDT